MDMISRSEGVESGDLFFIMLAIAIHICFRLRQESFFVHWHRHMYQIIIRLLFINVHISFQFCSCFLVQSKTKTHHDEIKPTLIIFICSQININGTIAKKSYINISKDVASVSINFFDPHHKQVQKQYNSSL